MVIAIDGPAGSGKSSIAKLLAQNLSMCYINSGMIYRAFTLLALENNLAAQHFQKTDSKEIQDFLALVARTHLEYHGNLLFMNGRSIEQEARTSAVNQLVPYVSSIPSIRDQINYFIRQIASQEESKGRSVVVEGRDMTSVVFPTSPYKFYLDASPQVRAGRRFAEGITKETLEEITTQIIERDKIDQTKKVGALKLVPDAFYIDCSDLTLEEVYGTIAERIKK